MLEQENIDGGYDGGTSEITNNNQVEKEGGKPSTCLKEQQTLDTNSEESTRQEDSGAQNSKSTTGTVRKSSNVFKHNSWKRQARILPSSDVPIVGDRYDEKQGNKQEWTEFVGSDYMEVDCGKQSKQAPPTTMRLLSWKVQGLGNPWTVRHLRELVKENKPSIVFLMETRLHDTESNSIRRCFLDFNFLVVNPVRRAGGLMLLWNKNLNVQITSFSNHYISFSVTEDNGKEWRGSGIYGWPTNHDKYQTWLLLRSLKNLSTLPWVCFGDFNEVLYSFEKVGARGCNMRELEAFAASCQYCDLYDLDRFLATPDWSILFPSSWVQNLTRIASDHSPIVLSQEVYTVEGGKKRGFRFEHMWLRDNRLRGVVEDAWLGGLNEGLGSDPAALVRGCTQRLTEWNATSFGHVQRSIRAKIRKLEKLQKQLRHDSSQEQQDLQNEIKELYTREEIIWRQRSRVQSWVDDTDGLCNMVSSYFENLFQSSTSPECAEVASCLDKSLSDSDIKILGKPVSESEVYNAVMQMHPSKAPGPDGMTALFYQKFWNIVGPTIVNVVRSGIMPPNINKTLITFIPKIPSPDSLKDLRPISLCNVIYKIVSKLVIHKWLVSVVKYLTVLSESVLVNRIKGVLPGLIRETQSAFVTGRVITNNAIVAFEIFHWLKNKKSGRKGAMALKVDMSKAYDRLEWSFIRAALERFRFPQNFINVIMACVTTVSFSFNINGQVAGHVVPTRAMIRRAVATRQIHGIKVCRGAPDVSHLFFADDSIFFTRASLNECTHLQNLLARYCRSSGQVINFQKSEVFFSPNVELIVRNAILSKFEVREAPQQTTYIPGAAFHWTQKERCVSSYCRQGA
ncbi:hypothetical protein CTI12_AA420120 [Artemisia annua]|uniref:Uncharacterized protein n=1 Tax=Artemisia annua TaxID=35608 RepID=A0A2U1M4N9_ARTAN|nr:hypothetical protein CTI12_AA420120 [Artemisia annua]